MRGNGRGRGRRGRAEQSMGKGERRPEEKAKSAKKWNIYKDSSPILKFYHFQVQVYTDPKVV